VLGQLDVIGPERDKGHRDPVVVVAGLLDVLGRPVGSDVFSSIRNILSKPIFEP
jgi:hypothetical protein